MLRRPLSRPVLAGSLVCLTAGLTQAVGVPLDVCFQHLESDRRSSCLDRAVAETGPAALLAELQTWSDPSRILTVVRRLDLPSSVTDPAEAARLAELLDLQGQAERDLGRVDDAARSFARALALDDGTSRLTWIADDGQIRWTASVGPGSGRLLRAAEIFAAAGWRREASSLARKARLLGASGPVPHLPEADAELPSEPLRARTWFAAVPEVAIPMLRKGEPALELAEMRGKVVILDFWASWCGPCMQELPALQRLYNAEQERGLAAVAINMRERHEIALATADGLGLTLPLGIYGDQLDRTFHVKSLPTLIVLDRQGRIRNRWELYEPGFEEELARSVREILAEGEEEQPGEEIARVLEGGRNLVVRWQRAAPGPVDSLTVLETPQRRMVLATSGRRLLSFRPDGDGESMGNLSGSAGQLRLGPPVGESLHPLVGFHPGGTKLIRFDLVSGGASIESAPAALFDARFDPSGGLLLGTVEGIQRQDADGNTRPADGLPMVSSLVWAGSEPERRLIAIAAGRGGPSRVVFLGADLQTVSEVAGPTDGWKLVADEREPAAVGVAPPDVAESVSGHLLPGDSRQAALITHSGQLLVIDLTSGDIRFRALWDGISALACGDLDGDGRDELVIGSGRTVTVLEAPGDGSRL